MVIQSKTALLGSGPYGAGEPHWMAFGREVLGHLLGCPERTSWQNCMEDQAGEELRAANLKHSFGAFDIMQE